VMIAIFILAILAGGFAYSMKVESRLAMNANREAELIWMGRSGVELARYVVAQQLSVPNEPYDSLNQKWAGGPGGMGTSNSPLADISLENFQIGDGKVSIKIVDLERKYNINSADESALQQGFLLIGGDASENTKVVNAILDWIDRDDDPHINGTESDFYQTLDPPYFSKNAPIDDLSELLLINGVTPEMYWGPTSTNHSPAAFQKLDIFGQSQMPTYNVGLVDIFTSLSTGKININTASALTLQMIPGVDENIAAEIIRLRSGPDGSDGTEDDMPFQNAGELINAGLSRQAVQQISRFCDVRSRTFEVHVNAEIGGYGREFIATIGRNSVRDVQVLSFYWK
jgi:type II secretory pathway component PulK